MIVAHLSDIHLCRELGGRRQLKSILQLVQNAQSKGAEHFIFSGDLVEYANHNELKALIKGLQKLHLENHQVTLVPGNHDIFPASQYRLWRSIFRFTKFPRYYDRFLEIAAPYLGEIVHSRPLVQVKELGSDTVLIAIDTNDYSIRNHRQSARGHLSEAAWSAVERTLHERNWQNKIKILAIHHFPYVWGKDIDVDVNFVDIPEVQRRLQTIDWRLILCGHAHSERGLHKLGTEQIVYNGASNPKQGYFICSLIDFSKQRHEIVPQKLEGRLFSGLRLLFARG